VAAHAWEKQAQLPIQRAKKILPEEVRKKMLCNVAGAHSLTRARLFFALSVVRGAHHSS
jgi:hypothetical protein